MKGILFGSARRPGQDDFALSGVEKPDIQNLKKRNLPTLIKFLEFKVH